MRRTSKNSRQRRSGPDASACKKKSIATIYDVAAHADVSKTTVSRVVNGEGGVHPDTAARVRKAIKALRFTPNKAARSLASKAEARVGLLYNNPSVAYFNELMIGALEGCGRVGVQLVVDKCEPGNPELAIRAVRHMVQQGINGMLLTAPLSESAELIHELEAEGVSVAGVATGRLRSDISCIGIDDFAAAYEMTQYLIGLGHRRIGYIKGHPAHTSSQQRYLGFTEALRDSGGRAMCSEVAQGFNSYRSAIEAAEALLAADSGMTAVFAGNDDMAAAMLTVANRDGLHVPQDLTIVGFDDIIAASIWPPLTTVRQPVMEIGVQAIDVIAHNINLRRSGGNFVHRNVLIPHQLVIRETSAPSRGASVQCATPGA